MESVCCLGVTQKLSGADQGQAKIYMVRGGQANRIAKCQPDWAGVLRDSTQQRTSSILPGDTKVGSKWSSRDIQVGDVDSVYLAKDWLEPLKQVFTYCRELKVRYGYIITEKELVVIRIRPFSQDHLRSPVNTQDSDLSFSSPKNGATAITSESWKNSKQDAPAEAFEELDSGVQGYTLEQQCKRQLPQHYFGSVVASYDAIGKS